MHFKKIGDVHSELDSSRPSLFLQMSLWEVGEHVKKAFIFLILIDWLRGSLTVTLSCFRCTTSIKWASFIVSPQVPGVWDKNASLEIFKTSISSLCAYFISFISTWCLRNLHMIAVLYILCFGTILTEIPASFVPSPCFISLLSNLFISFLVFSSLAVEWCLCFRYSFTLRSKVAVQRCSQKFCKIHRKTPVPGPLLK